MSLVPRKDDANRKAELARKKKDPLSFGDFSNKPRPQNWSPSPLSADRVKQSKKTEESK